MASASSSLLSLEDKDADDAVFLCCRDDDDPVESPPWNAERPAGLSIFFFNCSRVFQRLKRDKVLFFGIRYFSTGGSPADS